LNIKFEKPLFFSYAKTVQIHVLLKKNCPKFFFHQTMKKRNFLDLFFVLQKKTGSIETKWKGWAKRPGLRAPERC